MEFLTTFKIDKPKFTIDSDDSILSIGSCFAENIGEYFKKYKFNICANPYGVLYNPASIYNSFLSVAEGKVFSESDLIFSQDEFHSFYHHSDFSSHNANAALILMNNNQKMLKKYLPKTNLVIITYGTSIVYINKENNLIVSNCHKLPENSFIKQQLSLSEITEYIKNSIALLRSFNKDVKIIFTLSPVRHWKDGAVQNHISKSALLLGINECLDKNTFYFPSYEIVIDELRDYRFYKKDMIHPNEIAVEYIWEKFSETMFNSKTHSLLKEIDKINNAKNHKPRNIFSSKHQDFIKNQLVKIEELNKKYPHLNFDEDIQYFNSQIQ